jgi:hypothetical protein
MDSGTGQPRHGPDEQSGRLGARLQESQRWCRHGLSLWERKIRSTVLGEIVSTMPSALSWRTNSGQSHWESERPILSGLICGKFDDVEGDFYWEKG